MFSASTQRKHWMFNSEQELTNLREQANIKYIELRLKERSDKDDKKDIYDTFLLPSEERHICKQYELILRDFCKKFQPPVPRCVIGTSFHYFKRFYLFNSVMDYHPKHLIVTCMYLACKVEEFNVSITQFVSNIKGDQEKAMDIILSNELLLMQNLNYHLTVHNPYRAVEGLLIDIKARGNGKFHDPEKLRPLIDDFLDRTLFTDAMLLHAPSQIALAAVLYAANKAKIDCDEYIGDCLLKDAPDNKELHLKEVCRRIFVMVKSIELPPKDLVKATERKLEACRNQENNPDSAVYKRLRQQELQEEEEALFDELCNDDDPPAKQPKMDDDN